MVVDQGEDEGEYDEPESIHHRQVQPEHDERFHQDRLDDIDGDEASVHDRVDQEHPCPEPRLVRRFDVIIAFGCRFVKHA